MTVKLPSVYADCYQLTLELYRRTKNFPKQFRPSIAKKIEEASLELTASVRALLLEKKQDLPLKKHQLINASHRAEELKFLTQLCCDLDIISSGSFGDLSERISGIGKQIGALIRFYEGSK